MRSSGSTPANSGTGLPAITATTVGIDCAWKAAVTCGLASESTIASTSRPAADSITCRSAAISSCDGVLHVATSATTTGTVRESSMSLGNSASPISMTTPGVPAGASAAGAAGPRAA